MSHFTLDRRCWVYQTYRFVGKCSVCYRIRVQVGHIKFCQQSQFFQHYIWDSRSVYLYKQILDSNTITCCCYAYVQCAVSSLSLRKNYWL